MTAKSLKIARPVKLYTLRYSAVFFAQINICVSYAWADRIGSG